MKDIYLFLQLDHLNLLILVHLSVLILQLSLFHHEVQLVLKVQLGQEVLILPFVQKDQMVLYFLLCLALHAIQIGLENHVDQMDPMYQADLIHPLILAHLQFQMSRLLLSVQPLLLVQQHLQFQAHLFHLLCLVDLQVQQLQVTQILQWYQDVQINLVHLGVLVNLKNQENQQVLHLLVVLMSQIDLWVLEVQLVQPHLSGLKVHLVQMVLNKGKHFTQLLKGIMALNA